MTRPLTSLANSGRLESIMLTSFPTGQIAGLHIPNFKQLPELGDVFFLN